MSETPTLVHKALGDDPWELSEYERYRTPHSPITDDTVITISARSLHAELMCPICLDMLRNTMTAKECLHRFCQECITTALRSNNKECPTCRKKLVSKRSLRPDPNFDALIAKLYPDRDQYDALQAQALERLSQHHNTLALQRSIQEGMRHQAEVRRHVRRSRGGSYHLSGGMGGRMGDPDASFHSEASYDGSSTSGGRVRPGMRGKRAAKGAAGKGNAKRARTRGSRESSTEPDGSVSDTSSLIGPSTSAEATGAREVELVLHPCPTVDSTNSEDMPVSMKQIRYLKTTPNATVNHLCKYLSIRSHIDTSSEPTAESTDDVGGDLSPEIGFTIYVRSPASSPDTPLTSLDHSLTLQEVMAEHWTTNKPLSLYFSVDKATSTEVTVAEMQVKQEQGEET